MNSMYSSRTRPVQELHPSSLLLHPSPLSLIPSSSPSSNRSSFHRRSHHRRLPIHIGTMIADPVSIVSFILAVTFSVGLLLLMCTKQDRVEGPTGKRRPITPLVDDGTLDDVEPVRRQVARADEILAGKKGDKNQYMTMKQLEPSESFNKSFDVPSSQSQQLKK